MYLKIKSVIILFFILINIEAKADSLSLCQNQSHEIHLKKAASQIGIVNPDIATIHMANPQKLHLYGLKPGITSVYALDEEGHEMVRHDVKVNLDLRPLQEDLHKISPQIQVTSINMALRVQGEVASPLEASEIIDIVQAYAGESKIINHLRVTQSTQVNLRVRVAEISRHIDKELGIKWRSILRPDHFVLGLTTNFASSVSDCSGFKFGHVTHDQDINVFIDALAAEGLITILAEPDLTTLSGHTASFLAGGEFPVPISNNRDNVDVVFKEFGVRLSFTPVVQEGKRISIKVAPEVSEISEAHSVVVNGLRIPGLKTRRAETMVELMSGQSFAIAGLLQQNTSSGITGLPPLHEMPIIGALFRSSRFRQKESELVIIITPYLVQPVPAGQKLMTPLDHFIPASDFEREIKNKLIRTHGPEFDLTKIGFMLR
jgi:pilus assembly protein CpaC